MNSAYRKAFLNEESQDKKAAPSINFKTQIDS